MLWLQFILELFELLDSWQGRWEIPILRKQWLFTDVVGAWYFPLVEHTYNLLHFVDRSILCTLTSSTRMNHRLYKFRYTWRFLLLHPSRRSYKSSRRGTTITPCPDLTGNCSGSRLYVFTYFILSTRGCFKLRVSTEHRHKTWDAQVSPRNLAQV